MAEPLATEKQVAFITTLLEEKVIENDETRAMIAAVSVETTSRKQATNWISWLLAQPKLPKEAKPKPTYVDPPEGMHASEGPDGKGQITKVYKTRSGHIVAKALVQGHAGKWGFDYRGKRGLKGLSETTLMSAAEAKAFGKTYGICVNCAADLTDERSIYAGYGPVCAKNLGWWYPTMSEALAGLELSEKGEAMTKLVEMVETPKWETDGDTWHVPDYEGYTIDISPLFGDPARGWGVGLTWGAYPDHQEQELADIYPTLEEAKRAAIKWADMQVAELVKFEKEVDEALAAALAGSFEVHDHPEIDEAAIFDTPPTPVFDKPHLLLTAKPETIIMSGGGGPITSSDPGTAAKYEVTDVEIVEDDDDSDEPEFVEIPLESLLLGDDL